MQNPGFGTGFACRGECGFNAEGARHRRVNSERRGRIGGTRLRLLARTTPWQAADGVPPRGRRKQGRLQGAVNTNIPSAAGLPTCRAASNPCLRPRSLRNDRET